MHCSGNNIHIRLYMNSVEDVESFYKYIKPIVAHALFPHTWSEFDPVKLSIKWMKPTLCITIYPNKKEET